MKLNEHTRPHLQEELLQRFLELKDSDIRIHTLEQGFEAVDRGLHSGGAMSSVVPLVALYYGGVMDFDVANPTAPQDLFVLSKGHAVAAMASVYADLGYFDRSLLKNSRSYESILNGHPGPLLPGVHLPTGPMGQGICVAEGLALAGKRGPEFDVYALTGDGELQEGTVWEAVMYSAAKRVDNFCVLIDKNGGQLDNPRQNTFPMDNVEGELEAFGFSVYSVDGRSYRDLLDALRIFKFGPREGRPTAIVLHTEKGYGAFSEFLVGHKVTLTEEVMESELAQQRSRRRRREEAILECIGDGETGAGKNRTGGDAAAYAEGLAARMGYKLEGRKAASGEQSSAAGSTAAVLALEKNPLIRPAPPRNKQISFDVNALPTVPKGQQRQASTVIEEAMRTFAADERVFSVDADLASTSGLEAGVAYRDRSRAYNVGIAEANMMAIGEAFAILGANSWVSTFCPFFNWNLMRRIAINQQERLEVIEAGGGWLSRGHGLDLTFLATAANFDTKTNGATHMGNDDILFFEQIGGLSVIDTSCAKQVLEVMRWIMEGNRGLVYLRIMRSPSEVLYAEDYRFAYGKGHRFGLSADPNAVIISSGRGVHEALAAAKLCDKKGIVVDVVDMPSVDAGLLWELYEKKKPLLIAEQNNGRIWNAFRRVVFSRGGSFDPELHLPINVLGKDEAPRYIHSGTYEELLEQYGLSAEALSGRVEEAVGKG